MKVDGTFYLLNLSEGQISNKGLTTPLFLGRVVIRATSASPKRSLRERESGTTSAPNASSFWSVFGGRGSRDDEVESLQ